MSRVKFNGAPPKNPPQPVNKAEIQGQGSIPYATTVEEPTPDTMFAKVTTGKKRGMGAALRGSRFTNA
jgi:hypothetical protein|tara:strand:- start:101 stop:304 length:204 start_codon:yes stop_codon:yes gene_type:complete